MFCFVSYISNVCDMFLVDVCDVFSIVVSIRVLLSLRTYFKSKHDVFLTLTKWFSLPNCGCLCGVQVTRKNAKMHTHDTITECPCNVVVFICQISQKKKVSGVSFQEIALKIGKILFN